MAKFHFAALIDAIALLTNGVSAHGYLGQPAVAFPADVDKTQFIATVEASASGFSGSFNGSPALNTEAFNKAFDSSKYSSIKDFVTDLGQIVVNGATLECGLTIPDNTPQPLPNAIQWTHSDTEGFTASHEGPCEAWCDSTRVFHDTNCAAHFPTAPAKMPFDKAGCSDANRLTFYWLALHSSTWQIYVNCAPLEGGNGLNPAIQQNSTLTEQSEAPSVTPTVTPTAPTIAPSTPVATSAVTSTKSGTSVVKGGNGTSIENAMNDGEDCGSFDIAGGEDDLVGGKASVSEVDCGSLDVAGNGSEDCGSYEIAGSEDCGSLDIADNEAEQTNLISKSSLNFSDLQSSYISSKVQPQEQK